MQSRSIRNRKVANRESSTGATQLRANKKYQNTFSKCVLVGAMFTLVPVTVVLVLIFGSGQRQTYSYKLPTPPKPEGVLQPNSELKKAVRLAEGELVGPESLEMLNGVLYTGTADGRILAIEDDKITTIATFHQFPSLECGPYETEDLCGRPLGMRFDKAGFLYVVEAYSGLYKLNVSSGEMVHLVRSDDESLGQPMKFVNDLDVTSEGVVYFSDTSANFERRDFIQLCLRADKSGRLFKFDPNTNETVVVQKNIGWLNGVQVSPDEDYLLYSEGQFARIMKLHLKGPKKGEVEVFSDNLPGFPDNIRLTRNNTFWLAINALRSRSFSLFEFMTDKPWLRTLFLKVVGPKFSVTSSPKGALILELDLHGNIIRSLHDQDGGVLHSCSEVLDTGKALFIGSFQANFIGKLEL